MAKAFLTMLEYLTDKPIQSTILQTNQNVTQSTSHVICEERIGGPTHPLPHVERSFVPSFCF